MRNASKFLDARQRRATSPEDDVSSFCNMLKYDLRKLNPTRRKRLMHNMSGLMLEALEMENFQPANSQLPAPLRATSQLRASTPPLRALTPPHRATTSQLRASTPRLRATTLLKGHWITAPPLKTTLISTYPPLRPTLNLYPQFLQWATPPCLLPQTNHPRLTWVTLSFSEVLRFTFISYVRNIILYHIISRSFAFY